MSNIYNIFNEENTAKKSQPRLSKEEYAKQMKERRKSLFSMANTQTMEAVATPDNYMTYLQLQSKLGYTVTNTMLVMVQKPNASMLKDTARWRENNLFIKKGEKGIQILEPSGEYTRRDGTVGVNYNPKYVFDISQINIKEDDFSVPNPNDIGDLVSAIMYQTDVKPEVVSVDSKMPSSVYFDEKSNKIFVTQGLEQEVMVQGLIREYSFVECFDHNISRQEARFMAESAGYMIAQKYGIDYDTYFIKGECQHYFSGKDQRDVKRELENIKNIFENVSERMEHGLYAISQFKQNQRSDQVR